MDETYLGGEKEGKRGRGSVGKSLVLVGVEDKEIGMGRIRFYRIADASSASLLPAIRETVEPGSVVRTDGWAGYGLVGGKDYAHHVVRSTGQIGENLLPLVNRVVSLLKRWLAGTHQGAIWPSHLDYYLDEFAFRFNRRTSHSRGKLFYRLVQQAVAIQPTRAEDIKGGKAIMKPDTH